MYKVKEPILCKSISIKLNKCKLTFLILNINVSLLRRNTESCFDAFVNSDFIYLLRQP